jgi:hypothetical protein
VPRRPSVYTLSFWPVVPGRSFWRFLALLAGPNRPGASANAVLVENVKLGKAKRVCFLGFLMPVLGFYTPDFAFFGRFIATVVHESHTLKYRIPDVAHRIMSPFPLLPG